MNSGSVENEILAVVNVSDEVIGTATRGKIHRSGLLHRAVHVFLFNGKGEIYVQRRSPTKDRFPDRLDSSAAGHVDPGESYEQAAVRELHEELGITAHVIEILRLSDFDVTDNEHVTLFKTITDAEPAPEPSEIQWGAFMTDEELSTSMERNPNDFVPAFIVLWREYKRNST